MVEKAASSNRTFQPLTSMLGRNADGMMLAINLVAFGICAAVAFSHNSHYLFAHLDGVYMVTQVRNHMAFDQPAFAFSNDFMQSIGNVQFLQNPLLLFYFWPISWFADLGVGKIVVFLIIAVMVFMSGYSMGRLLSQDRPTALTAGWLLGVLATPFVPEPFFYPLLGLAPSGVLLVVSPIVGFWLLRLAGRSNLIVDVLVALGLAILAWFLLAANPAGFVLILIGAIPYLALALFLVRHKSELIRKLVVLIGLVIIAICLRWPWYLAGLFSYTAPNAFPNDFPSANFEPEFVSILFQGSRSRWAAPVFALAAIVGAFLSLRHTSKELRTAAYVVLALVAALIAACGVLVVVRVWKFFGPIYLEVCAWPLYSVFAVITLKRAIGFATSRLREVTRFAGANVRIGWLLPAVGVAIAGLFAGGSASTETDFSPHDTPMVNILKSSIAIAPGSSFNGRVATIIPVDVNGGEPWTQQFLTILRLWQSIGNDQATVGLWHYRIPTLLEYNQFTSPVFHALIKRALQRPALPHSRNITVYTYANARILKLLGVRYVIMPQEKNSIGVQRATQEVAGQHWGLFELSEPNLATYSPTSIEIRNSLASALDFVLDDSVDLTTSAVAHKDIGGPFVPAEATSLSMSGGDLHVVAQSSGRSLLVVPLEFSHCIELRDKRAELGGSDVRLVRIDGVLTGVVFERHLDAVLAFRIGPTHNQTCRWQDYQELRTMLH